MKTKKGLILFREIADAETGTASKPNQKYLKMINQEYVTVEQVTEIKKKLYQKLMPDLSGKTQQSIDSSFEV